MIGLPQKGLIFLSGILLLPPRAGIRATFLTHLPTKRDTEILCHRLQVFYDLYH